MPKHAADVEKDSTPFVLAVQLPSQEKTNDVPVNIFTCKMTNSNLKIKIIKNKIK